MSEDSVIDAKSSEKIKSKKPSMHCVILCNDDYTTANFVVAVLVDIFKHSIKDAIQLMSDIHTSGAGIAGQYTLEICETKADAVHSLAETSDFPLRCKIEKC